MVILKYHINMIYYQYPQFLNQNQNIIIKSPNFLINYLFMYVYKNLIHLYYFLIFILFIMLIDIIINLLIISLVFIMMVFFLMDFLK